jgi:ACT domain-containing protein
LPASILEILSKLLIRLLKKHLSTVKLIASRVNIFNKEHRVKTVLNSISALYKYQEGINSAADKGVDKIRARDIIQTNPHFEIFLL